jgi:hypothetical protein
LAILLGSIELSANRSRFAGFPAGDKDRSFVQGREWYLEELALLKVHIFILKCDVFWRGT